jgi:hypothetical protein
MKVDEGAAYQQNGDRNVQDDETGVVRKGRQVQKWKVPCMLLRPT